ncbi:unnamed protein product [Dovyalis caffra]|uniref:Uncharacterized protein n=1 Tax=Dovyalis caffra TaxID=77055 RepID=A0AAV1SUP1_9ROSI|nr:unnamed protein product [Dovyalis caffra]
MTITVTRESVRHDSLRSTMGEQIGARSLEVRDSEDRPDRQCRSGVETGLRECGTTGEPEKEMKRGRVN